MSVRAIIARLSASCSSLDRANGWTSRRWRRSARESKYEETVVALAALAKVPIKIVDRLMGGDRPDPVLILCKAADLSWPTVKAVILARPDGRNVQLTALDAAFANYGRLSASTAHRVVRFWQVRRASIIRGL